MGLPTTYHSSTLSCPTCPQSHIGHSSFPARAFCLLLWSIDLVLSLLMVEQRLAVLEHSAAAEPVVAYRRESAVRTKED